MPQSHIKVLEESPADHPALLEGLQFLINISYVDDVEVFKTCLDYWHVFVSDVFNSVCATMAAMPPGEFSFQPVSPGSQRRALYDGTLSKLRALMINRMAKPEVNPWIMPWAAIYMQQHVYHVQPCNALFQS